jgi:hypothetical protein
MSYPSYPSYPSYQSYPVLSLLFPLRHSCKSRIDSGARANEKKGLPFQASPLGKRLTLHGAAAGIEPISPLITPGVESIFSAYPCKLSEDKSVVYRSLGDAVIVLHFLWILFILFGLFIAIKYGRIVWVHLGGLVFTLIINICGWFCPLTYLENHLYSLYNPRFAYSGSFIARYLQKLIYLDVDEVYLRMAAVIWVGINLGGYILLFKKRKSVCR